MEYTIIIEVIGVLNSYFNSLNKDMTGFQCLVSDIPMII